MISNAWMDEQYKDIPEELRIEHGWGNGYVAIPKGHILYGMDYNDIAKKYTGIEVSGGLTFSNTWWNSCPKWAKDCWIVGFDTFHAWDNMSRWPDEESVLKEAKKLRNQILDPIPRVFQKTRRL